MTENEPVPMLNKEHSWSLSDALVYPSFRFLGISHETYLEGKVLYDLHSSIHNNEITDPQTIAVIRHQSSLWLKKFHKESWSRLGPIIAISDIFPDIQDSEI